MLDEIEARLREQLGAGPAPVLRDIGGAAAYASVDTMPPLHLLPAAYIVPLTETAMPRQADALPQAVQVTFGIILAVSAERADPTGGQAVIRIEPVRAALRAALMGWTAPGAQTACQYAGGDLIRVGADGLWWQDSFSMEVTYG